jgi:hypothetical protein
LLDLRGGNLAPTHAWFRTRAATAKPRARTLASRMCLPLLIFMVDSRSRPAHCAWYKNGYSEIPCEKTTVTHVFDFLYFYWCAKRIRISGPSTCISAGFLTSYFGVPPDMPPSYSRFPAEARFLRKCVKARTIWFQARRSPCPKTFRLQEEVSGRLRMMPSAFDPTPACRRRPLSGTRTAIAPPVC